MMQILAILHLFKHKLDSWGDVGSKDRVCLVFDHAVKGQTSLMKKLFMAQLIEVTQTHITNEPR